MALAGSRPVYVCLQTIYGLNSGVFLSTLLHMPYPKPGRGLALYPECVYTPIYPAYCLFLCPPGYVHLYVKCCQSITAVDCFSLLIGHESEYEGALSRRLHALT